MKISEILESHRPTKTSQTDHHGTYIIVCTCGTRHPEYDNGRWPTHEQHVADLVNTAQADAWDKGCEAAEQYYKRTVISMPGISALDPPTNPYRQETT